MKEGHDLVPDLGVKTHKHPVRETGKRKPLTQQDAKLSQTVNVEAFLAGLPPVQVNHYMRTVMLDTANLGSASQRYIRDLDFLRDGESLILTFVSQTWYSFDGILFTLTPIAPDVGNAAPALFTIYANGEGLLDDTYLLDDPTAGAFAGVIQGTYTGTTIRDENILLFGRHRTGILISDNQMVQGEWKPLSLIGGGFVTPAPFPDNIKVTLKGFTIPSKVLAEARRLYGI